MKKLFAAACTAVFILASCQEESFEVRPDIDNYFASVETFGSDTRTALQEGNKVVWSEEDCIAIFEGTDIGQAYQVLESSVGKTTAELARVEGFVIGGAGKAFDGTIAVYPFDEGLTVTSGNNGVYVIDGIEFPSEQHHAAGSFSDEAFPMAGQSVSGSRNLSLKNIGGVMKLSLTGDFSVSRITITGNSDELLSGSATVTLGANGIPSVTMCEDASKSVSLVCAPAVQLDPDKATDFYISIPPTEFKAGFKVSILDEAENEHGLATLKNNSVKRSIILAMPETTPESLDDIELTADMFCSLDFTEGWTETRFGGDGTIVFVKEDEQGRMTHSLMFLPDEENILMPVYIKFDENEIPSYMSFMDTEIYIDGYTDSTIDFTLAVKDAVWSVKDVPCSELVPYSLQTRAWADNNGIRNACAIGNCIVGAVDIGLGVLLIGGAVVVEGGSVGLATPAAVPTIAAGLVQIGAGCKSLYDGFSTIFGPADQKRDPYIANMIIDSSLEGLAQFLEHIEVKENPIIQNFPKEITEEAKLSGKIGLASFIAGMSIAAIDAKWGKTYTGPATLAEVHQEVQVVTGRADNVTEHSAELYGYVSPAATAPFGEKICTEIYIVLWKVSDKSIRKHYSTYYSDGGIISFIFSGLESGTTYCYQTLFQDVENGYHRFGEVKSFTTKDHDISIEILDCTSDATIYDNESILFKCKGTLQITGAEWLDEELLLESGNLSFEINNVENTNLYTFEFDVLRNIKDLNINIDNISLEANMPIQITNNDYTIRSNLYDVKLTYKGSPSIKLYSCTSEIIYDYEYDVWNPLYYSKYSGQLKEYVWIVTDAWFISKWFCGVSSIASDQFLNGHKETYTYNSYGPIDEIWGGDGSFKTNTYIHYFSIIASPCNDYRFTYPHDCDIGAGDKCSCAASSSEEISQYYDLVLMNENKLSTETITEIDYIKWIYCNNPYESMISSEFPPLPDTTVK